MANITGTNANDQITGTSLDDVIQGLDGSDTIYGRNGNDKISGGNQMDFLYGEAGNDWLSPDGGVNDIVDGGAGIDTASFEFEVLPVSVDLSQVNASGYSVATGLSGSLSNLVNIENLYGGAGNDSLTGNSQANTIWGNGGIDTIKGGDGDDLLWGGAGTDYMNGGAGNDVLDGYGQPGQPTPITRQFREFDNLTGGAGADRFILGAKQEAYYRGSGHAVIKDFNKSQDKIQLKGSKDDYNMVEFQQGNITSTGIFHGRNTGVGGDLVANLEGVTGVSFTTGNFSFVQ